jgi:CHAT domain-containing protein
MMESLDSAPLDKITAVLQAAVPIWAAGGRYLSGAAATRAEFLANAASYEVLHLCCHGAEGCTAGGATLLLADGPLIVDDLTKIPPLDNVALAVLSACWSGQADWFNPEESTDIGSLLLAADAARRWVRR